MLHKPCLKDEWALKVYLADGQLQQMDKNFTSSLSRTSVSVEL